MVLGSHPIQPHPTNSWDDNPPTNPSPYKYQTLNESEIRLLVLLPGKDNDPVHCRLDHASLPDRPKYETISYAWGDPNMTSTVVSAGNTIQVTDNLHTALRHLRYETGERTLWADAVCIDQQNMAERSVQVLLMGEIYAHSHRVIVWLGEETEAVSESITQILKLNAFFMENEEGYPDHPDRWNINPYGGSPNFSVLLGTRPEWEHPLANIARIHWFVRRWVVQEVAKSPAAIVVLGKKEIPWITMADVTWSLHKAGLLSGFALLEKPEQILDGFQSILLIELVRRDVIRTSGSKLLELLISTRRYKCMDDRDVIYSQLGVINDLDTYNQPAPPGSDTETEELYKSLTLSPNYESSTEEVYHRFVLMNIIKKKSLLTFSATYIPPTSPTLNLPSWVPDFSKLDRANSLMHMRNESALPFKASKGSELQARFSNEYKTLHIKGRIIDVITDMNTAQEEYVPPPEIEEQGKTENWTTEVKSAKHLFHWFKGCIALFNPSTAPDEGRIYGLTPDRFEVFARTLVCNLSASGSTPPPDFAHLVHIFLDVNEDNTAGVKKHLTELTQDALTVLIDGLLAVEGAMGLRAAGWCFAVTEGGRSGRVLKNARKGDKVVLFDGGEVPYLLRKREEGGWTFVASCYMFGLMDGEGMALDGLVDEEFDIY